MIKLTGGFDMAVDFRMTKKGLILLVESFDSLDNLKQEISQKFAENKSFFTEGDEISLMLTEEPSKSEDIVKIVGMVRNLGIGVKDILVGSADSKNVKVGQKYDLVREKKHEYQGCELIRRNLRSGQIVVHNYDVIVMGNVNNGAEIIAGGNIVVMGSVRGVLRAGYAIGSSAIITALDLKPNFLQIGSIISQDYERIEGPCVAHVKTGRIINQRVEEVTFDSDFK